MILGVERNPFDTIIAPLSDMDFSFSKQTIPISPHPGTCFVQTQLALIPASLHKTALLYGRTAFQRGRNYRKQRASLSVGGHSSLWLPQPGRRTKTKVLCKAPVLSVSGRLHAAAAQGHRHVFVDDADGRKEEKETSRLDQVHRSLSLH